MRITISVASFCNSLSPHIIPSSRSHRFQSFRIQLSWFYTIRTHSLAYSSNFNSLFVHHPTRMYFMWRSKDLSNDNIITEDGKRQIIKRFFRENELYFTISFFLTIIILFILVYLLVLLLLIQEKYKMKRRPREPRPVERK